MIRILALVALLIGSNGFAAEPAAAPAFDWTPKLTGFAHFWNTYDRKNPTVTHHNQFRVQRFRLSGTSEVTKELSYFFNTEMADGNPDGTGSAGRVTLLDANATYKFDDLFQVRVGQDWYRFTREGTWTLFEIPFILRAETVDNIWFTMGRQGKFAYDRGVFFLGNNKATSERPIEYTVSVTEGSGLNTVDQNNNKDFTGRVAWQATKSLNVAANGFFGHSTTNSVISRETAWAADFLWQYENQFRVWGEWVSAYFDGNTSWGVTPSRRHGGYLAAAWTPAKDWDVLARYAVYDPNRDTVNSGLRTITLGATYAISGFQNLKLNYVIRRKDENYQSAAGLSYRPGNMVVAQLQVFFFPEKAMNRFHKQLGILAAN